jgi:autotransporter translocation and assembly factor TamB
MRLLRRLLTGIAVLVAVLVALLGVLRTEAGSGLVAQLAMQAVPGLRLEGLRLNLPWGLAVARLELADAEGVWLTLEDAVLALAPGELLRGDSHRVSLYWGSRCS